MVNIGMNEEFRICLETHRMVYKELKEVTRTWIDEYGIFCAEWKIGRNKRAWFHYKIENGEVIWW